MSLADLCNQLPDYAKDLRLNLHRVLSAGGSPGLDGRQIRAVALASAIASRHARVSQVPTTCATGVPQRAPTKSRMAGSTSGARSGA